MQSIRITVEMHVRFPCSVDYKSSSLGAIIGYSKLFLQQGQRQDIGDVLRMKPDWLIHTQVIDVTSHVSDYLSTIAYQIHGFFHMVYVAYQISVAESMNSRFTVQQ